MTFHVAQRSFAKQVESGWVLRIVGERRAEICGLRDGSDERERV